MARKRCPECLDMAREHYQRRDISDEDLNWWCWMFGCEACLHALCGADN